MMWDQISPARARDAAVGRKNEFLKSQRNRNDFRNSL